MNMWDRVFEACRQEIERRLGDCGVQAEDTMQAADKVFLIAIDGMCGSGKSTVAGMLQEHYGCRLFHMDDFFLQPHQRTPERLGQPGGNVDYERFREEVLEHLTDQEGLEFRRFDCGKFSMEPAVHVPYNRMVIIEGAYSCHPHLGDVQDVRIFLESSRSGQLERILGRSGPEKLVRFKEVWIPMEEKYFETFGIREKCFCVRVD